jgi:hypothetical protein
MCRKHNAVHCGRGSPQAGSSAHRGAPPIFMDAAMKPQSSMLVAALAALAMGASQSVADFEVKGPDGRRILLKDDKTWRYLEDGAEAQSKPTGSGDDAKPADENPKNAGEAVLYLDDKIAGRRVCRFKLRLVNSLPYEIRSLVPEFSIHRASGVVYDSVFAGFAFVKPGDTQLREVRFNGISCDDIARLQVGGGDRCEMGDLDKFSPEKGRCLAHVRVVPSDVVRFDK